MNLSRRDIAQLEAAMEILDQVSAGGAELQQQVLMANGIIGKLLRSAEVKDKSAPRVNGLAPQQPKECEFAGLSLAEAASKHLSNARKSQSVTEIIQALTAARFLTGRTPNSQLTAALDRRSRNYTDLVRVKRGRWCLREFLTPEEVAQVEHNQRTKKGVVQARERGVRFGAKPKISEDVASKLKPLLAAGLSLRDAGDAVGISHTTIRYWKPLIDAWEPGQPWPPIDCSPYASVDETTDNVTQLRAVK